MKVKATLMESDSAKWNEAVRNLTTLGGVYGVRAGVPAGAKNDDGESIPEYAAVNEYGSIKKGIPPRPFLRSTLEREGGRWVTMFANAIKNRVSSDDVAVRRAFMAVGRMAQGDIRATIKSNMPPPNDPKYAVSKQKRGGGYSGTLVNTGAMLNSVDFELVGKNGGRID